MQKLGPERSVGNWTRLPLGSFSEERVAAISSSRADILHKPWDNGQCVSSIEKDHIAETFSSNVVLISGVGPTGNKFLRKLF